MIEKDYVKYALDNYRAPYFDMGEFNSDLSKVVSLKKMLRRYTTSGQINERLMLNTIIILINVFGVYSANVLMFYKVEPEHHSIIKTFLVYLDSYIENDFNDDVALDPNIVDKLKDITCRSSLDY